MKQANTLLTAIVAGTTLLFTACKKDSTEITPSNTSATTTPIAFKMVSAGPNVPTGIMWNAGYMNAASIYFEGKNVVADQPSVQYKSAVSQRIDLFSPTVIGDVRVNPGTYYDITFRIRLAPSERGHALFIAGKFVNQGEEIPLMVVIDQQFDLTSVWKDKININSTTQYLSLFTMSLVSLTDGIDIRMLRAATKDENGAIVISRTYNTNLYNRIIYNLQKAVSMRFNQ